MPAPDILASFLSGLRRDRERWILWLPVFFGTGIAIYFGLRAEPPWWIGPAALIGAGLAAYQGRERFSQGGQWGLLLVAFAITACGFWAAQWRTADVAHTVLGKRIGPTAVTGRVAGVEAFPGSHRVTMERVRIAGLGPEQVPEKIRIRLRGSQPDIIAGAWIRVRAILSPPPPPSAPGAFDFQRQSWFRRLGGVGFGLGAVEITAPRPVGTNDASLQHPLDVLTIALARLRQAITIRVQTGLGGTAGAIAAALMTGERSAIPEPVMQTIRDSGIAHLLAISGLHIGLVAGILFLAVRTVLALVGPWALRFPIKKWAAASAVAGAFAYALIAGATVPTQRAFLMVGLVLLAVMLDRRGLSIRLVAWAALTILILQPESLLGPSFQMSFAAVIALIATYEAISERRRYDGYGVSKIPLWLRKAGLYLAGVALTTVVAGLATAPFAVFHFNRIADYGLAANLVAVPVTALWVMPWAVMAFLLMPFGLEGAALLPMGWGVDVIIKVAETVSQWSGAVTLVPAMPVSALVAIALGGLWLALWRRRWRFLGVGGLCLGVLLAVMHEPPDVLVDGQGRLLAVRTTDGRVAVSTLRRARYEREIWLRRFGEEEARAPWPKIGTSSDERLTCDRQGCLYRARGSTGEGVEDRTVALVFDEGALAEDCWAADVVISVVPVRIPCPAPLGVIDRFDLWRGGAAAIWLRGPGRIRIETVNGLRGTRPWVVRPQARTKKNAPKT
ncbi:MAG: ComEC/Rec2 family competence protein [Rhodospirillales bacterium]|nr:ComEC/Rec2 family competence protein [Rhodospirillales bacterium]